LYSPDGQGFYWFCCLLRRNQQAVVSWVGWGECSGDSVVLTVVCIALENDFKNAGSSVSE